MASEFDLQQRLEALIPKTLDDIVRFRRNHMTIRLATDMEIMELHHEIVPNRAPSMIINDWRLVAFVMSDDGFQRVDISLLGDKDTGGVRITSPVRMIDLDRQLVITQSGTLYGMGKAGQGEPPFDHLVMICAATHSWGFGALFGIPHFFY